MHYRSPEEYVKEVWPHEDSHRRKAEELGVRGDIRYVIPYSEHYDHAYVDLNINDLARVSRGRPGKLFSIMGQMNMAPFVDRLVWGERFTKYEIEEAFIGMTLIDKGRKLGETVKFPPGLERRILEVMADYYLSRLARS